MARKKKQRDTGFLKVRTDELLEGTLDGSRSWERQRQNLASTTHRVVEPTDGEDYLVRMHLKRVGSNGDTRYVLISHETGLFARCYTMRSEEYQPLQELGEIVFDIVLDEATKR